MAVLELHNELRRQAWPFAEVQSGSAFPVFRNEWIWDAGFTLSSTNQDQILGRLWKIDADPTEVRFFFFVGSQEIEIPINRNSGDGYTVLISPEASNGWTSGFIQFGNLDDVPDGLSLGQMDMDPVTLEVDSPSRVMSLSVANTVSTFPWDTDCEGAKPSTDTYVIEAEGLDSDVVLRGGRWMEVTQVNARNQLSLKLAGSVDGGGTEPCGEGGRIDPPGVVVQETSCGEVINTLNGVSPAEGTGAFTLSGARGIAVRQDPSDTHGLVVVFNTPVIYKRNDALTGGNGSG